MVPGTISWKWSLEPFFLGKAKTPHWMCRVLQRNGGVSVPAWQCDMKVVSHSGKDIPFLELTSLHISSPCRGVRLGPKGRQRTPGGRAAGRLPSAPGGRRGRGSGSAAEGRLFLPRDALWGSTRQSRPASAPMSPDGHRRREQLAPLHHRPGWPGEEPLLSGPIRSRAQSPRNR